MPGNPDLQAKADVVRGLRARSAASARSLAYALSRMDPAKLLEEVVSNPGYAEGRRSFPRTVTPYDALTVTAMLHATVDAGCEARADTARARGLTIACTEAIRIAEWLELDEQRATREAFLAAFPAWRERAGDGFERITAASGQEARLAAHLERWRRKVPCAFNEGGLCSIYEVRPRLCRNGHALGTNERCNSDRLAARLS
jgi:Fe-S-cluster containining protein